MAARYVGENLKGFQEMLGRGGFVPLNPERMTDSQNTSPQQNPENAPASPSEEAEEQAKTLPVSDSKEQKLSVQQQEDNDEDTWSDLLDSLDYFSSGEIRCPFCRRQSENGDIDCPHLICYVTDYAPDATAEFKILEAIIPTIANLYDYDYVNWEGIFQGIPYWEKTESFLDDPLGIITEHPSIRHITTHSGLGPCVTVHTYLFVSIKKKEKFKAELMTVKERLLELIQKEGRDAEEDQEKRKNLLEARQMLEAVTA